MNDKSPGVVAISDFSTAATLAICLLPAWLFSVPLLKRFCRSLASVHVFIKRRKSPKQVCDIAIAADSGFDVDNVRQRFMETVYEEVCYTLREHRSAGWRPDISLRGREHIDKALERGRGAVLWIVPCSYAELVVKKALYAERIPLINLRSYIHPYSSSRVGKRFLNPIRTRVEDRYLLNTVVLHPQSEAVAMRELQLCLRKNSIVSIFAIAAGERSVSVPCLSGTLNLAAGAPTLAQIAKAPLLPVYTCETSPGKFEVRVGHPLRASKDGTSSVTVREAAIAFAEFTAEEVSRCPNVWRGWMTNSLWRHEGCQLE